MASKIAGSECSVCTVLDETMPKHTYVWGDIAVVVMIQK